MGVSSGLSESDLSKSRCTKASTAQQSILPLAGILLLPHAPGQCGKVFYKSWEPDGSRWDARTVNLGRGSWGLHGEAGNWLLSSVS